MSEDKEKITTEGCCRSDRISVSVGETINRGNFESSRIDVGVSTDVKPEETDTEAYNRAVARAHTFLADMRSGIHVESKPRGRGR